MVSVCMYFSIVVNPQFSEAEITLYSKRLENGYDLHDPRYEQWLHWKGERNYIGYVSYAHVL